jgi:hypothetical protein
MNTPNINHLAGKTRAIQPYAYEGALSAYMFLHHRRTQFSFAATSGGAEGHSGPSPIAHGRLCGDRHGLSGLRQRHPHKIHFSRRKEDRVKDFKFINDARREAQKAKEAAAAKARELSEEAPGRTENLKAKASGVKEQFAEQVAGMGDIGLDKLNETLADFNAALPVLREAGYTLDGVNIEFGVPPKIVANSSGDGAPDEKIEALLAENAEHSLTFLLVKSIQHATKLQSKLHVKGLRPRGLSFEIGFVPKVVVKFAPS